MNRKAPAYDAADRVLPQTCRSPIMQGVSRLRKHPNPPERAGADMLDERALRLGAYIAEHAATVRSAAKIFGISKSTVHKDITVRLPRLHAGLAAQVREIIEKNKQERHIRGGLATKRKYEKQRCAARHSAAEQSVR